MKAEKYRILRNCMKLYIYIYIYIYNIYIYIYIYNIYIIYIYIYNIYIYTQYCIHIGNCMTSYEIARTDMKLYELVAIPRYSDLCVKETSETSGRLSPLLLPPVRALVA